jgi:hypothetical protein
VASIKFLVVLRTGKYSLSGVYHNDVIAHIEKRGPSRIVLAGDHSCNFRRQTADRFSGSVNDVPFPVFG